MMLPQLMERLEVKSVIVPPYPGFFSALGLAGGDLQTLRTLATPVMQATGLHILTITDQQGVIQVRAHDPQAIGVNIATNPLIRAGLRGKAASRMTQVQDGIALAGFGQVPTHGGDAGDRGFRAGECVADALAGADGGLL